MKTMSAFDPLIYINIDVEDKKQFSDKILDRLSKYLAVRLIELVPEEELGSIDSIDELFELAKKKVPDINEKVEVILDEFKNKVIK